MEFRILGLLQARTDSGEVLPLVRRKLRLLIAGLLLNANTVVPVGRLVDWMWGEKPPSSAVPNLRSYVAGLRRLLAAAQAQQPGPVSIQAASGGYVLRVDPSQIDAGAFEGMVESGRRAAAGGEYSLALGWFSRALGLWRAPTVLEGLSLPEPLQVEAVRLEQLRAAVVEELFETRLALGQHREMVPELEAAVRKHPLREGLWVQRMLALYRSGRQAEALDVYQEVRGILATELGRVS